MQVTGTLSKCSSRLTGKSITFNFPLWLIIAGNSVMRYLVVKSEDISPTKRNL